MATFGSDAAGPVSVVRVGSEDLVLLHRTSALSSENGIVLRVRTADGTWERTPGGPILEPSRIAKTFDRSRIQAATLVITDDLPDVDALLVYSADGDYPGLPTRNIGTARLSL